MIGAWIISMISLPILKWIWGESIIPFAAFTGVIFQFLAVFTILLPAWGIRKTIITTLVVAIMTWGAEAIGSTTGFPFGAYHYTELLQPQLTGVPLVIPLAWMMMLAPSWALAEVTVKRIEDARIKRLLFVFISSLAITAWDLYLDPQMVGWGFWAWQFPEGYFGIPWINYLGWIVVSALVTIIVRPDKLPVKPLILVYGIVWILQAIGLAFFWGQPGPALFGFLGMGSLLLLAYTQRHENLN